MSSLSEEMLSLRGAGLQASMSRGLQPPRPAGLQASMSQVSASFSLSERLFASLPGATFGGAAAGGEVKRARDRDGHGGAPALCIIGKTERVCGGVLQV